MKKAIRNADYEELDILVRVTIRVRLKKVEIFIFLDNYFPANGQMLRKIVKVV